MAIYGFTEGGCHNPPPPQEKSLQEHPALTAQTQAGGLPSTSPTNIPTKCTCHTFEHQLWTILCIYPAPDVSIWKCLDLTFTQGFGEPFLKNFIAPRASQRIFHIRHSLRYRGQGVRECTLSSLVPNLSRLPLSLNAQHSLYCSVSTNRGTWL